MRLSLALVFSSRTALLGVMLVGLTLRLAAAATPVESAPTAVTVYPDRAVVTRTAQLTLAAGAHELAFGPLPAGVDADSLRVAARGAVVARILDVAARTEFVAAAPDPRLREIEEALRTLAREQRRLDDRAKVLGQQLETLQRIEQSSTTVSKETTAPRLAADDWVKLLSFTEEQRMKLAEEARSLDVQREELAARRAPLEQQQAQLSGAAAGRQVHTVVVRLEATGDGAFVVDLSYTIGGASWTPSYDARLDRDARTVALGYFAMVRQTTGEDWRDVRLTLSTARPSLGGGAPELSAWVVDVVNMRRPVRPTPDMTSMAPASVMAGAQAFNRVALGDAEAVELDSFAVEGGFAEAALTGVASSASFRIAAPATITSDNAPQRVGITQAEFPAKLQFQATPRQLEAAFLGAYLTNATDFPLLAGPLSAFVDDTFIARSQLRTVMAGEKFDLALGVDDGIAVKRRVVNRFTEQVGLTSGTTRVTYEVLVTLTNNKTTAERVVFKEPLPVSRHEQIVVRLLAPAEREVGTLAAPREVTREEDGKLVWRVDLKPGEKREFPLRFSVEHPRDVPVNGLE